METTDPGIMWFYFSGLVLTIILTTFLRYGFYRSDPRYNNDKRRLIPRGVYILMLIFSFVPILNDVLAGVAIVATIVLSIDGTLMRDSKFTRWLNN